MDEITKTGYVLCTINGGKKIGTVLYGSYHTDPDDDSFFNFFEIDKVICGDIPEWLKNDNKIYEGATAFGDYFDEFRVIESDTFDKHRVIKFVIDNYDDPKKSIYRTFNLRF